MNFHMRRFAVLLCPVLLLSGCGSSGQQRTARLLDQRLQTSLAKDIAAGRAAVQPFSGGARVTLLDTTMFSNTPDALDNRENDVRASVVEALLDPRLMRLQVADSSTLSEIQRETRVRNVEQYLVANGLGLTLQPAEPLQGAPADATSTGVTVTINVQCPDWHDGGDPAGPSCH